MNNLKTVCRLIDDKDDALVLLFVLEQLMEQNKTSEDITCEDVTFGLREVVIAILQT